MCGIVGILNTHGDPVSPTILQKMTDRMVHRGPDGEGFFIHQSVGFGHRRLAILDLSPSGQQPMQTQDGRYIINYNGEIYNYRELRVELQTKGYQFHSNTDTEVALYAYAEWGEEALLRFKGMFAMAILDLKKRQLFLARDRYGIKPLYWYFQRGIFLFASEIKALLEHPDTQIKVSYPALNEYFSFQNIFTDLTLFDGIRLLEPGSILYFDLKPSASPIIKRYWDYPFRQEKNNLSEEETASLIHQLVLEAVTRELVSDVPIGSYLSGGIDSGSIASIASKNLTRLSTFTCGFDLSSASGLELGFDERSAAEMMANCFKTEHYEVVMHAGDMEWVMPELIWHLEDLRVGQCYPNYYVARLAGKFVKVVLSGIGGDEVFGGYPWRYYRGINSSGRSEFLRRYYEFWQRLVPDEEKKSLFPGSVLHETAQHESFEVFQSVFSGWPGEFSSNEDFINASLYFELKTFLHGLLVVEDKLSMAHSLEARVPFLDNDLVDFGVNLPPHYRLKNLNQVQKMDENIAGKHRRYELQTNDGKLILRKAMQGIIPSEIIDRTKQGFSAPDASWFRGESIDYINRLLGNPKSLIYEFVNRNYVDQILDDHCSGRVNKRLLIWSLISFEWWCRKFLAR